MLTWLKGILFGPGKHQLEEYGVNELTTIEELDQAVARSAETPIAIYKHSTTCPISAAAHRQVAQFLEQAGDSAPPVYMVRVIESRPVSNEIAHRLGVRHQSPQLIVVTGGEAQHNMSHGSITGAALQQALDGGAKKS
jgi:bacillithiol system protein YtxJ